MCALDREPLEKQKPMHLATVLSEDANSEAEWNLKSIRVLSLYCD